MRRLAITSLCAIALLSGCAHGGDGNKPHVTVEAKPVNLPCAGDGVKTGDWKVIDKKETKTQTLRFHTDNRCKFTDLWFDDPQHPTDPNNPSNPNPNNPYYPPGFSNRQPPTGGGETISYDYKEGTKPIPDGGYYFYYSNDYPKDGGGGGIIKYIPY